MPFDGTQLNPTAAHLLRAKRYIEEHGWCSHGPRDGSNVCVGSALALTGPWYAGGGRAWKMLGTIIAYPRSWVAVGIGDWNDTPGRTIEEVYDAFDRAIALAMESGK